MPSLTSAALAALDSLSGTNTGDQTTIAGITGTKDEFDAALTDGDFVFQSGPLGTPSSGDGTNLTGTAAGLTAGAFSGQGTMSTQNANAVAITGGTISGLTSSLPVASGGTGINTLTVNLIPYGNGTGAFQSSAALAYVPATNWLQVNGVESKDSMLRITRSAANMSSLLSFLPHTSATVSDPEWNMGKVFSTNDFSVSTYDGSSTIRRVSVLTSGRILGNTAGTLNTDDGSTDFQTGSIKGTTIKATTNAFFGGTTTPTALIHAAAGTAAANTAPFAFTLPGIPLTTPEAGRWDTDAERLYYTKTSLIREALVGCIFTQTATQTVSNVGETTLFGAGVGFGRTLPANFFVAGKTLRVMGSGVFSTQAVPGNVTINVYLGATLIATGVITNILALAANNAFDFMAEITCRTTGATGTVMVNGKAEYDTGVLVQGVLPLTNAGAVTTVDTTASKVLDVKFTWATQAAANTISTTTASVEVLN